MNEEEITFMRLFHKLRDLIGDDPNVVESLFDKLKSRVENELIEIQREPGGDAKKRNKLIVQYINDASSQDLFPRRRNLIENDSNRFEKRLPGDDVIEQACNDLWNAGKPLNTNGGRQRGLFSKHVYPNFVKTWRNYETRYLPIFTKIYSLRISPIPEDKSRQDYVWDRADEEAKDCADGITASIQFANKNYKLLYRMQDSGLDFPDYDIDLCQKGTGAWDDLVSKTDFDLQGVLRRLRLVPFVLIPRHVANRHGDNEKLSLFTNLRQAQEAFIFGVPFAALALMRSVMEVTLKTHYQAPGVNLK
ncbi:MAG: hypothetical protein ABL951_07990, partial [Alphaproteobacteria bacterium]